MRGWEGQERRGDRRGSDVGKRGYREGIEKDEDVVGRVIKLGRDRQVAY